MPSFLKTWSVLCQVDIDPLAGWIEANAPTWPRLRKGQPQRIKMPSIAGGIVSDVLACFDGAATTFDEHYACLSRVAPGEGHGYHQDSQRPGWITRVHVPVVTNDGCWMMFESEDGVKVHFERGKAYSFNIYEPHAFANEGTTERIHLLFDVYAMGT